MRSLLVTSTQKPKEPEQPRLNYWGNKKPHTRKHLAGIKRYKDTYLTMYLTFFKINQL
jgi:hypothetical protein